MASIEKRKKERKKGKKERKIERNKERYVESKRQTQGVCASKIETSVNVIGSGDIVDGFIA